MNIYKEMLYIDFQCIYICVYVCVCVYIYMYNAKLILSCCFNNEKKLINFKLFKGSYDS